MLVQARQGVNGHIHQKKNYIANHTKREKPVGLPYLLQQSVLGREYAQHEEWIEVAAVKNAEVVYRLRRVFPEDKIPPHNAIAKAISTYHFCLTFRR